MTHLQTVQSIYAAFGRGDVPSILEHLHEDVQWEHDFASNHGIPYLLPGRGRAQAQSFFAALSAIEITHFEPFDFLTSEHRVVTLVRISLVNKKTGKKLDDYETHVWTLDDKHRVTAFRHVVDTHAHVLANQP